MLRGWKALAGGRDDSVFRVSKLQNDSDGPFSGWGLLELTQRLRFGA